MAPEEPDIKQFHHGVLGNPPAALVIQIPIAEYAAQGADGLDMFYGKMKRMEVIGAALIKETVARKRQNGIVTPPDLRVS